MKPRLHMLTGQSAVNGRWGYCPKDSALARLAQYDDEAQYLTADHAKAAAAKDATLRGFSLSWTEQPIAADQLYGGGGPYSHSATGPLDHFDR